MAQDIIVRTLCDICLSDDEERHDAKPYQVAIGGVLMDIDLCDVHGKPLDDMAEHARPVKASRKRKPAAAAAPAGDASAAAVLGCDVPGCGRAFPTAQGLSMHRYRAHGIRSETPEARRQRGEREGEPLPGVPA